MKLLLASPAPRLNFAILVSQPQHVAKRWRASACKFERRPRLRAVFPSHCLLKFSIIQCSSTGVDVYLKDVNPEWKVMVETVEFSARVGAANHTVRETYT
eukprot:SAG11_NODE_1968_length_3986_cov_5.572678_1_plen_99_part_10